MIFQHTVRTISTGKIVSFRFIIINSFTQQNAVYCQFRVGRTARAGRSGKAITMVTQYDVELYQRIEHLLGKQLPKFETEEDEVMALQERVGEAQRTAKLELKDIEDKRGSKTRFKNMDDDDDTEQFNGARKRIQVGKQGNNKNGKRRKF